MSTTLSKRGLGVGWHELTAEEYHSDPCEAPSLSRSIAHTLITRSPLHAHTEHSRLGGVRRKSTRSMDFGDLVHTLMLRDEGQFEVLDFPDWRTKAAQEARALAGEQGKTAVLRGDYERALNCCLVARRQLAAMGMADVFTAGRREIVGVAKEGEAWVRAMFDEIHEGSDGVVAINDLKTTTDAHPDKLVRKIMDMGYELQDAFYTNVARLLIPHARKIVFRFFFLETAPPFAITPVEINGEWKAIGQSQYQAALSTWQRCVQAKRWPGYAGEPLTLHPPEWLLNKELGRESAESVMERGAA